MGIQVSFPAMPFKLAGRAQHNKADNELVVKLRADLIGRSPKGRDPASQVPTLTQLLRARIISEVIPVFGGTIPSTSSPSGTRDSRQATPVKLSHSRGLYVLRLSDGTSPEDVMRQIQQTAAEVELTFQPAIRYPVTSPNDPLLARQWNHVAVSANGAGAYSSAHDVVVAVVDTGIDMNHPDLAGVIESYTNYLTEDDTDYQGHGTHVSGIIAAVTNNGIGIAGLCGAKIQAIKALPGNGEWDAAGYYRALGHPLSHGASVVNLSLGGAHDPGEEAVVQDLLDGGITVIAAMGNEFEQGNPVDYPAALEGVIAVGATDENDKRAPFSNTGRHIAVSAPGTNILSTVPVRDGITADDYYDSWSGTSMATPHVSAAAALLLARRRALSPTEVKRVIMESADAMGPRDEFGAGRLNIARLLSPPA